MEERGLQLNLDVLTVNAFDRIEGQLQTLTKSILNIAVGTVSSVLDILISLVVTVILTFYLLLHGDEIWQSFIKWLPNDTQQPVSQNPSA